MPELTLTPAQRDALLDASLLLSPDVSFDTRDVPGFLAFMRAALRVVPSLVLEPATFREALAIRCAELSDPDGAPWPTVRFDSVPNGKSAMDVPVWSILRHLAPDGATPVEEKTDDR